MTTSFSLIVGNTNITEHGKSRGKRKNQLEKPSDCQDVISKKIKCSDSFWETNTCAATIDKLRSVSHTMLLGVQHVTIHVEYFQCSCIIFFSVKSNSYEQLSWFSHSLSLERVANLGYD